MVREVKNKYFIGQQMLIIDDDGCGYLDYIVLIELLPSGELLYNTRQGVVFTEENRLSEFVFESNQEAMKYLNGKWKISILLIGVIDHGKYQY